MKNKSCRNVTFTQIVYIKFNVVPCVNHALSAYNKNWSNFVHIQLEMC